MSIMNELFPDCIFRHHAGLFFVLCFLLGTMLSPVQATDVMKEEVISVRILWGEKAPCGSILVANGRLGGIHMPMGTGRIEGNKFSFDDDANAGELVIDIEDAMINLGSGATVVTIKSDQAGFSFFLRDPNEHHPIIIPQYGVVVTEASDQRSYETMMGTYRENDWSTQLEQLAREPEESFDQAASQTRDTVAPTWLGMGRDMRIFELNLMEGWLMYNWIQPKFHGTSIEPLPGKGVIRYNFSIAKGCGPVRNYTRRLEDGIYPILTGCFEDGGLNYDFKTFTALEKQALTAQTLRGTESIVATGYAIGHTFTSDQGERFNALNGTEQNSEEQTVLYFGVHVTNPTQTPRYAWFKSPVPNVGGNNFEPASGFSTYGPHEVYCVSRLQGEPLAQEEIAVLVEPGESIDWEFYLPHRPISRERASQLARQDFGQRHEQALGFWKSRISKAAHVQLPETRIEEMMKAGLMHLDLVNYGREPEGTLTPCIGIYCPIGSESSPIIQYMDSMGWHDEARRSIQYFLDMQHEDGMIQNFGGYMLETGAVLWTMGEHYRYTQDLEWVRKVEPNIRKANEYLFNWIQKNNKEELRGFGYGMIDGKVADPPDPFHVFMLNGYAYLGLMRSSEMMASIDPDYAASLKSAAQQLRDNTRDSFFDSLQRAPVVPLSDGSWCPAPPPWPEGQGLACLYVKPEHCWTHGTFMVRDSLLGPLYLAFQEILEPEEIATGWMLNYHTEMMCENNVAMSQPYYSRHPWILLKRGEVNAFLKAYYNAMASLADRETYSFMEHYFGASPHKTHEEAWFLMQSRWMLYLEEGTTLNLLPGVARQWLQAGQTINLENCSSYFGPFNLRVESTQDKGLLKNSLQIHATVESTTQRHPETIRLRLPHPQGKKATHVKGGIYDAQTEAITIENFNGRAEVSVTF